MYEFDLEDQEQKYAEWIRSTKEKKVKREQERLKRIDEIKQQLRDRPNPYEKEIETCEHLIAYFNKLKVLNGLGEEKEQSILDVEKSMQSQFAKEDITKKVTEGKIERAKTKEEREQESMMQFGGKKKKQQRKQKDVVVEEAFKIDFTVINKLSFLKISPPLGPTDLDAKVKELEKRREEYEAEGEKKLSEENIDEMDIRELE